MSETREARPTEYKGVRFRSKSEAMFARCLDLAGCEWGYEPPSIGKHQWDFIVAPGEFLHSGAVDTSGEYDWFEYRRHIALSKPCLVEYKPQRPTGLYFEQIRDDFAAAVKAMPHRTNIPESMLVFGSFFDLGTAGHGESLGVWPVWSTHCSRFGKGDFRHEIWGTDGYDVGLYNVESVFGITRAMIAEASRFRFDLCIAQ
jgi:hypothetical protein